MADIEDGNSDAVAQDKHTAKDSVRRFTPQAKKIFGPTVWNYDRLTKHLAKQFGQHGTQTNSRTNISATWPKYWPNCARARTVLHLVRRHRRTSCAEERRSAVDGIMPSRLPQTRAFQTFPGGCSPAVCQKVGPTEAHPNSLANCLPGGSVELRQTVELRPNSLANGLFSKCVGQTVGQTVFCLANTFAKRHTLVTIGDSC